MIASHVFKFYFRKDTLKFATTMTLPPTHFSSLLPVVNTPPPAVTVSPDVQWLQFSCFRDREQHLSLARTDTWNPTQSPEARACHLRAHHQRASPWGPDDPFPRQSLYPNSALLIHPCLLFSELAEFLYCRLFTCFCSSVTFSQIYIYLARHFRIFLFFQLRCNTCLPLN